MCRHVRMEIADLYLSQRDSDLMIFHSQSMDEKKKRRPQREVLGRKVWEANLAEMPLAFLSLTSRRVKTGNRCCSSIDWKKKLKHHLIENWGKGWISSARAANSVDICPSGVTKGVPSRWRASWSVNRLTESTVSNIFMWATVLSWRASFFKVVSKVWKFWISLEVTAVEDRRSKRRSTTSKPPAKWRHSDAVCTASCRRWISKRSPWGRWWSSIAIARARIGLREREGESEAMPKKRQKSPKPPNLISNLNVTALGSTKWIHSQWRFDSNNTVLLHWDLINFQKSYK